MSSTKNNEDYSAYVDDFLSNVSAPRCGVLDVQPLGESKWGLSQVAWTVTSFPTGLSQDRVLQLYQQAFDSWAAVCGMTFKRVSATNQANILIGTGRGRRANFDGENGTLAWAYLPSGANFKGQVEVRFDLDETWIDNPGARGILLLNVACHEFGHTLGLSHNSVANQLLNPYYKASLSKPQSYDIEEIQSLYGKPTTTPGTPSPPTVPGGPSGAPKAAKILGSDGRVWYSDVWREVHKSALTTEGAEAF